MFLQQSSYNVNCGIMFLIVFSYGITTKLDDGDISVNIGSCQYVSIYTISNTNWMGKI